jgi:hypothetical protein
MDDRYIEIDGHKYPVQDEYFPLSLQSPFMYGDNTLQVQKYLNKVYGTKLTEHGIYGHATEKEVKAQLEIEEVSEDRMTVIKNYFESISA